MKNIVEVVFAEFQPRSGRKPNAPYTPQFISHVKILDKWELDLSAKISSSSTSA